MAAPLFKSRPTHGKLEPRAGAAHLLVADAEGAEAILDLAQRGGSSLFAKAQIYYVPGRTKGSDLESRLAALGPFSFTIAPSISALLPKLKQVFATARMGLQVYLSGTEGLIGQVMKVAMDHGIDHRSISTEHRGSLARRVQCVHCKGITEDVRTQPVVCAHCGLILFVRDHYSRRIAAFQGVCIDAEEPGSAPASQEIFP
jgi:hypothetical protein